MVTGALTLFDRTSRIKIHTANARSRLFCRIAKGLFQVNNHENTGCLKRLLDL